MSLPHRFAFLLCVAAATTSPAAEDLSSCFADRAAIERVYHVHRTGKKVPFDEWIPAAVIEQLVRRDLKKEAVLKKLYGIEISRDQIDTEIKRIDATTRAPEILVELKRTLGNDPSRFARTIVRPIIVDRELRRRFGHDDQLHAERRRQAEHAREELLAAKLGSASVNTLVAILKHGTNGSLSEFTWQLGHAPAGDPAIAAPNHPSLVTTAQSSNGLYILEGTAQIIPAPSSPDQDTASPPVYFNQLPAEFRRILAAQLQRPGDISAVIETPSAFLLYLAKEKTSQTLVVARLEIGKRSYEEWLELSAD